MLHKTISCWYTQHTDRLSRKRAEDTRICFHRTTVLCDHSNKLRETTKPVCVNKTNTREFVQRIRCVYARNGSRTFKTRTNIVNSSDLHLTHAFSSCRERMVNAVHFTCCGTRFFFNTFFIASFSRSGTWRTVDVMLGTRIYAVMLLKIYFLCFLYAVLDVYYVSDVVMMVKR